LQTLIAGGGAIGSKLAVFLSQRGEDVTVIDEDKEKCEWLSKNSDAKVYNGSLLDPELLMEAGIDKADAFIVALGDDQLTRKVVDFAKSQFGVPKVVAIAKESDELDQIKASGADTVVCSQDEVLKEVENVLQPGTAKTVFQDRQGECLISRVTVRATSAVLGKAVHKIEDKFAKVSGMIRNRSFLFPNDDTTLEMGDELFVIGKRNDVEKLVDLITEEV
jgi:trk system potassium uptake protein